MQRVAASALELSSHLHSSYWQQHNTVVGGLMVMIVMSIQQHQSGTHHNMSSEEPTMTRPAIAPMMTAAHGSTNAHGDVDATKPAKIPTKHHQSLSPS